MTAGGSRNHWIALDEHPFAEWQAVFAPPVSHADVDRLLRFARGLLDAGEREGVYRIVETRPPLAFHARPGWTYADMLAQEYAAGRALSLFDLGLGAAPTRDGVLRTPARLCYFDSTGKAVSRDVDNAGELLARLRPDDIEAGDMFMAGISPVTVLSRTVTADELQSPAKRLRAVQVRIALYTDIWFRRVLGMLDLLTLPATNGRSKLVDNAELAACHTPRLNAFVRSTRALALELGAEWRVSPAEGMATNYVDQVTEFGLDLGS